MIAAEGEQKASRALREASEVIGDSPAALQLRYLQVKILNLFKIKLFLAWDTVKKVRFVNKFCYFHHKNVF